jgi:hypothetical protein
MSAPSHPRTCPDVCSLKTMKWRVSGLETAGIFDSKKEKPKPKQENPSHGLLTDHAWRDPKSTSSSYCYKEDRIHTLCPRQRLLYSFVKTDLPNRRHLSIDHRILHISPDHPTVRLTGNKPPLYCTPGFSSVFLIPTLYSWAEGQNKQNKTKQKQQKTNQNASYIKERDQTNREGQLERNI